MSDILDVVSLWYPGSVVVLDCIDRFQIFTPLLTWKRLSKSTLLIQKLSLMVREVSLILEMLRFLEDVPCTISHGVHVYIAQLIVLKEHVPMVVLQR